MPLYIACTVQYLLISTIPYMYRFWSERLARVVCKFLCVLVLFGRLIIAREKEEFAALPLQSSRVNEKCAASLEIRNERKRLNWGQKSQKKRRRRGTKWWMNTWEERRGDRQMEFMARMDPAGQTDCTHILQAINDFLQEKYTVAARTSSQNKSIVICTCTFKFS